MKLSMASTRRPAAVNFLRNFRTARRSRANPRVPHVTIPSALDENAESEPAKGFFDSNPTLSSTSSSSSSKPQASSSLSSIDIDSMVEELKDTSELGERGEALFIIQSILILLVVFPAKGLSDFVTTLGFFSFLGGLGIIAWSANGLGDSLSPLPKPRENAELVTDGPYEFVRHPMYGGLILTCLGLGIATSNATRVVISLALLLLLDKKATKEEGFLVEKFGEDYVSYQKTVKKLIPWIY